MAPHPIFERGNAVSIAAAQGHATLMQMLITAPRREAAALLLNEPDEHGNPLCSSHCLRHLIMGALAKVPWHIAVPKVLLDEPSVRLDVRTREGISVLTAAIRTCNADLIPMVV